ncbi:enoyl-CoA hydratase/isomerase family protein, partial [Ilumatobacter sp.]|uniref:enoyl-CoA hydratase/isomerase family protein n=1 Tax=Ilumatobacter sp. TaxID=1967498 RepID=UPI003C4B5E81
MADDRELIRYEAQGRVGVITIDRPEKRNAMTFAMLGQFIETVARADADPDTVVLVITGVAGSFCAGTDLADLATIPGESRGLRG